MGFIKKIKEFNMFLYLLNKKIDGLIFRKKIKIEMIDMNRQNILNYSVKIDEAEKDIIKLETEIKYIDKKINDFKNIL